MRKLAFVAAILLTCTTHASAQSARQVKATSVSRNAISEAKQAWFAHAVSDILDGAKSREQPVTKQPSGNK